MKRTESTILSLGPADHGRPLTAEEFDRARWEGGFHYELIEGRLYVSPEPNLPHNFLQEWLHEHLLLYKRAHPEVINYVASPARIFLPDEPEQTRPEPDLAAYHAYPAHLPVEEMDWRNVSPVLVVEILSEGDVDKDFQRNVNLYLRVPSIQEYWVIDPRSDYNQPALLVYRRRGQRWQNPIRIPGGGTYTPIRLLPDFSLTMDVRA
jgi:Uma2 family endonuclease